MGGHSTGRAGRGPGRVRGFTLIELLVVIAIIGILVGLTMPALAGVRAQSRRLKCLTNLKGFGVTFQLYLNDHKKLPYVLPFYDIGVPHNPNDPQLLDVLEGYVDVPPPHYDENNNLKTYEPYLCPSDRDDDGGLATGMSYQYWAGGLMLVRELLRADPNPAATVTFFYEQNGNFPVLADAKPWHTGGKEYDQNGLYFGDWRADWLLLDPQSQIPTGPPGGPPGGQAGGLE